MTKSSRQITQSVSSSLAKLRADAPGVIKGFNALAEAAMADGALTRKTKELIALALGVAGHCDACLGFHLKALIKLGATRIEVEEALGVAVYMGGGPSLMYAADALAAFEELSAPTTAGSVIAEVASTR
jgi:AhpD family alkylhydroperoxidase